MYAQGKGQGPASLAPCQSNVSSFPYDELFEAGDGSWFSSGQNSDWAWGTPAKTVISGAGEGTKCWITGGLTGDAYNDNEFSWLQSPCFDFSTLINPEISFKIFWETERKYDGAKLEYSVDGGSSWTLLGSENSNNNCPNQNWYNSGSVNYLGNTPGWSGNTQSTSGSCLGGSGSGAWLQAKHELQMLAGKPSVAFRFTFASGTTCNAFEGFAIDAVHIGEAPVNNADFTYSCGADRSVSFTMLADCSTARTWNFGDPASGAGNISTDINPVHVFSGSGSYQVSLLASFATGAPVSQVKPVNILDAALNVVSAIKCFGGSTGSIMVTPSGSANPYTYSWNTIPAQTMATINNLAAGTYTVTVNSLSSCGVRQSISLAEPADVLVSTEVSPAICTAKTGGLTASVTGGTVPYKYVWSNGATTSAISNLSAGTFSLKVADVNNCTVNLPNLVVPQTDENIRISFGNDTIICPGQTLLLKPGNFAQYKWQDNSTASTFAVSSSGTYSVNVVSKNGCTGAATIKVTVDCSDVYFPTGFTPNGDGRNDLFGPAGNTASLKDYTLTVYDRYGETIFHTSDPFNKWDGRYKGSFFNSGSFVWQANYKLNGKSYFKKGTLTMIK